MIYGLNVDPSNAAGRPDPASLLSLHFGWVRMVSKPAHEPYAEACRALGLKVLAIVTGESNGYIMENADAIQVGNEMDGTDPAAGSWPMTEDEYLTLWAEVWDREYHGADRPLILGGLVSGIAARITEYMEWDCAAIAIHPYGKTPEEARALIRQYKGYFVGTPPAIWITEWNRPAEEMAAFLRMCAEEGVEAVFWYAATQGMNPGFGLLDAPEKLEAWRQATKMAEFIWDIKTTAEKLAAEGIDVGEPVGEERYIDDKNGNRTAHIHQTTKGVMWYTPEGNFTVFLQGIRPNS